MITTMLSNRSSEEQLPIHSSSETGYSSIQDRISPGPGRSSTSSEPGDGYTELMRGSVPCPTCRGLGNVPKGNFFNIFSLKLLANTLASPVISQVFVS